MRSQMQGVPMTIISVDGEMEPPDWPDPDPDQCSPSDSKGSCNSSGISDGTAGTRPAYVRSPKQPSWAARPASRTNCRSCSARDTYGAPRDAPRTIELRLPGQPTVRMEAKDLADAVDLPSQDPASVPVPLYGQIAAGPQNLTERIIGDTWDLPKDLGGDGTLFRLRIRGDSMINAAVADGDMVVVRQQSQVENADIVAAMIDGETTVKTFQRVSG
jgi:SOS-response transcriptional repressor LexA